MIFKVLKGYEKYIIFEDGKILSIPINKYMNPSLTKDGYYCTMFNRKTETVHRLIAKAFVPNPHNKPEVNHIDGNKLNNHYTNLEWCTRGENIKHCYDLGLRSCKGENNSRAKVKQSDIENIKALYKQGKTQKEVGIIFGISPSQAGKIINNKSW
jgi:hypothetical protein